MKCPYRKKIRIYPDGLGRVTEVDFLECDEKECPYWGAKVYNVTSGNWEYGCRRAENECS